MLYVFIILIAFSSCKHHPATYPAFKITVCKPGCTGYYFLCAIKKELGSSTLSPVNMILDSTGHVVYYHVFEPGANIGDFKLQPNGLISYSKRDTFYLMDSTFKIVDSVFCKNGIFNDRHDFHILRNGHFLLLGYEYADMDLSNYHLRDSAGYTWGKQAKVKCGVFEELDQNKQLVFEWHAKDHYQFTDADESYFEGPGVLDWTHFNSIEADSDGNYLLSVRNFNEVTKISSQDGAIIWRLGGKQNQFAFINDSSKFSGQHDAQRLANGNILLYDDGNKNIPFHPAAAREYRLNEDSFTAKLVWQHVDNPNAWSQGLGNAQRLDNGRTLISYGRFMQDSVTFNVIDTAGNKVFELAFTSGMTSYKVFNYAQLPFKLK